MKQNKIVILLLLLLLLPITKINATIVADVESDPIGPSNPLPGSGSATAPFYYSIYNPVMLKISLVNVESTFQPKASIYYPVISDRISQPQLGWRAHFMNFLGIRDNNYYGPRYLCDTNGCYQIPLDDIYVHQNQTSYLANYSEEYIKCDDLYSWTCYPQVSNTMWFMKGNYSVVNGDLIKTNLSDEVFFQSNLNLLTLKAGMGEFDLKKLTNEQTEILKKYRIVIEPVFAFRVKGSDARLYATTKGIARLSVQKNEETPFTSSSEYFIGGFAPAANSLYAVNTHGVINANGFNRWDVSNYFTIDGKAKGPLTYYGTEGVAILDQIYRGIADPYNGQGYGIYYIVNACDPTKECCYDNLGNYNSGYNGTISNYRCVDGVNGEKCQEIEACEKKENCQKNDNPNLNCAKEYTFNSSCSNTISVSVSAPSECTSGKEEVSANVKLNQTGTLMFRLPTTNIYSGGGFEYGIDYINTAYWNYETYPVCPSITVGSWGPYYCNEDDSLSDKTCTHTEIDNTDPENPVIKTTTYRASRDCETYTTYADNCGKDDSAAAKKIIENAVKEKYITLDKSNVAVTLQNSNNVNGSSNSSTGTWECNKVNASNWSPGETLTSVCSFTLKNAYIKRDSGAVYYGDNYSANEYLSEGNKYFTPLKYSGDFPINAIGTNMSSISGINWGFTYNCSVNCIQEFYDEKGYLFYYRPITLAKPFPNNREPGYNWYSWYMENKTNLLDRLSNTYDNLEYTVVLTNETIAEIKAYNETKVYNGTGYLDFSVNKNGASLFINSSSFITRNNSTYCNLGEGCDNK